MSNIGNSIPTNNANFALAVINRAVEIVAGGTPTTAQQHDAFSALQQAWEEFKAGETRQQEKSRTCGWSLLRKDIGEYIKSREPAFANSHTPITDWGSATDRDTVAQILREAALPISRVVEERTRWAAKFDSMAPKESMEYDLMRKAAVFLKQHGLTVQIAWDREDPNDPIDYRGTVDGVGWAFELTELRIDAKGSHVKMGHPNERKSIKEQLAELAAPVPQIPDGSDALQKALHAAAKHGGKASKLEALNGARYCLVLHNRQFLYAPDWEAIRFPGFGAFDAVLTLHQESFPPAQIWQVFRNGFGKPMRSHNVSDLGDIVAFRNSRRAHSIDTDRIRSTWRKSELLGLTDDDIRAAVAETRAQRNRV